MTRLKSGRFLVLIPVLVFLTACLMSKSEGQLMASDIDRLKTDVATLQRQRSDSEILQQKQQASIENRIEALENVSFKKAANEGHENDRLQKELEALRGQIEEMQKGMESAKPSPAAQPAAPAERAPEGKKGHFEWAKDAFEDEKYDLALSRIESFLDRYKEDKTYGVEAYMMKGDAAVALAKNASADAARVDFNKKALSSYQDLLTRFPKSTKIPEALFKVGETMRSMGFAKDAKVFYREIVENEKYAKSPFVKQAKERLRQISQKK